MAGAHAFVFDVYGTLFDVHAAVVALRAVIPDAEVISQLGRAKPLEYRWLRSLMGRSVDFWAVTDEALPGDVAHSHRSASRRARHRAGHRTRSSG